jgi:pyruvate dehydrogenase E2 component (dihydrolipoamide acetyltransferase)
MPVNVILPMLGETMDEATIVQWLAEIGQPVKKGEPLFQVETDKAILDVDSPADGVLTSIVQGKGSKVAVLTVVGTIASPAEDFAEPPGTSPAPASAANAAPAVLEAAVPRSVASPRARKLARDQGLDLTTLHGSGPGGRIVAQDVEAALSSRDAARPRVSVTPLARKVAAEAGVELGGIAGSGTGGRIVRADVPSGRPVQDSDRKEATPPAPAETVIPMSGVRRIIAERMSASSNATARVSLTTEADATELVRLRTLLKDRLSAGLGLDISYTDILVAVVARALRDHPYMNARLVGEEIRWLSQVNVGVAVDTERGLLVPVIRNADAMGITRAARTLRELVERARGGKSTPDDLTGGTFTITNLGVYEVDAFTPIINLPECAILGVGRLKDKPVVHQGQICIRTMIALSLTFDHRLVDGAPAARFLQRIKTLLEEPLVLLT